MAYVGSSCPINPTVVSNMIYPVHSQPPGSTQPPPTDPSSMCSSTLAGEQDRLLSQYNASRVQCELTRAELFSQAHSFQELARQLLAQIYELKRERDYLMIECDSTEAGYQKLYAAMMQRTDATQKQLSELHERIKALVAENEDLKRERDFLEEDSQTKNAISSAYIASAENAFEELSVYNQQLVNERITLKELCFNLFSILQLIDIRFQQQIVTPPTGQLPPAEAGDMSAPSPIVIQATNAHEKKPADSEEQHPEAETRCETDPQVASSEPKPNPQTDYAFELRITPPTSLSSLFSLSVRPSTGQLPPLEVGHVNDSFPADVTRTNAEDQANAAEKQGESRALNYVFAIRRSPTPSQSSILSVGVRRFNSSANNLTDLESIISDLQTRLAESEGQRIVVEQNLATSQRENVELKKRVSMWENPSLSFTHPLSEDWEGSNDAYPEEASTAVRTAANAASVISSLSPFDESTGKIETYLQTDDDTPFESARAADAGEQGRKRSSRERKPPMKFQAYQLD